MSELDQGYGWAWAQFLIGKNHLLAEYERAKEHANSLPVKTHHGNVGEAQFRAWLESFLPKQFGVTSGYIRGQRLHVPHGTSHFDVIIYDQLRAPILWVERNDDKSSLGRSRMIPAQYVKAVFEVKSQLSTTTVRDGLDKLLELSPLMADTDKADERYPTYLPTDAVLGMVFFEAKIASRSQVSALVEYGRTLSFNRGCYGPLVLSGEGLAKQATGLAKFVQYDASSSPMSPLGDLLTSFCISPPGIASDLRYSALLDWDAANFAKFAFDLLAIMQGTYDRRLVSSFFGIDVPGLNPAPG